MIKILKFLNKGHYSVLTVWYAYLLGLATISASNIDFILIVVGYFVTMFLTYIYNKKEGSKQ